MKTIIHFTSATICRYIVLMIAISFSVAVHAQTATSSNADEQAIRNLVAQSNAGDSTVIQYTDDRIFVSGAYPMPIIGKGTMSASNREADKKAKARKNFC